jgi:hypothetical protein
MIATKQKLEMLKSNVTKKEIEKNKFASELKETQHELEEATLQKQRFMKLFKQTQAKLGAQEKMHAVAVS